MAATYAFAHAYFLQTVLTLAGTAVAPSHQASAVQASLLAGTCALAWVIARFAQPGARLGIVRSIASLFLGLVMFVTACLLALWAYLHWGSDG